MNLQIDTTQKTIKVTHTVKLEELYTVLDKLFPNKEWKEYSLETNVTINNWTNPIIIREYPYWRPWYTTTANMEVTTNSLTYNAKDYDTTGIYNVEIY